MWQSPRNLLAHFLVGNIVSTIALITALLILRALALNAIHRWNAPSAELRRRWIVQIRNAILLAFLLGMIIIWAAQIKEVAISLLAVAVACVLATKELIVCFTGGILIGPGQDFHQYTGRAVTIPNSLFLSSSVVNENYTEKYVVHASPSPSVDPRVSVVLPEPGKITLLARVPVPVRRKGRTEQEIVRRYLQLNGEAREGDRE